MNVIKVLFDEIVARIAMVVLAILVLFIGLYSPDRLIYTLVLFGDNWFKKGCDRC